MWCVASGSPSLVSWWIQNDGPIKIVVASTFDEIVLNESKDVYFEVIINLKYFFCSFIPLAIWPDSRFFRFKHYLFFSFATKLTSEQCLLDLCLTFYILNLYVFAFKVGLFFLRYSVVSVGVWPMVWSLPIAWARV